MWLCMIAEKSQMANIYLMYYFYLFFNVVDCIIMSKKESTSTSKPLIIKGFMILYVQVVKLERTAVRINVISN